MHYNFNAVRLCLHVVAMVLNFQQKNTRVDVLDMMTISFYLSLQIIKNSDNRCSDNRVPTVYYTVLHIHGTVVHIHRKCE